jgi:hypothetical protein
VFVCRLPKCFGVQPLDLTMVKGSSPAVAQRQCPFHNSHGTSIVRHYMAILPHELADSDILDFLLGFP